MKIKKFRAEVPRGTSDIHRHRLPSCLLHSVSIQQYSTVLPACLVQVRVLIAHQVKPPVIKALLIPGVETKLMLLWLAAVIWDLLCVAKGVNKDKLAASQH
ncbi:unnamed protein product [Arctogadus glacialis]